MFKRVFFIIIIIGLVACESNKENQSIIIDNQTQEIAKELGITDVNNLSAASKRAIKNKFNRDDEWWTKFKIQDIKGDISYEEGVIRRDPSAVLFVNDTYYVYYSKSIGKGHGFKTGNPDLKVFPWDKSEVWYASSKDGWTWEEVGLAIGRGAEGSYDDRSVFTPEVMLYDERYYLVYQTVKAPYVNRVKNQVGLAIADSPHGPWTKLTEPILSPADNGEWAGDIDNRFQVLKKGDFDSQKVHDPCLMHYNDKFFLYYKGERMGEGNTLGGREIKWGVAIADKPEGPYVKSSFNPVTNSGHEVCVWPYQGGMAAMLTSDGPENNTIQYSKDGINFEIMAHIGGRTKPPHAAGIVRSLDSELSPLAALEWGLCFDNRNGWDYIKRFEIYKRKAL